jgi:ethanolamine transporter EutH
MKQMLDPIVIGLLFSFIVAILASRYILNKRFEARERKQRMEEEARRIAETNSGL